jgi:hypothetical protein
MENSIGMSEGLITDLVAQIEMNFDDLVTAFGRAGNSRSQDLKLFKEMMREAKDLAACQSQQEWLQWHSDVVQHYTRDIFMRLQLLEQVR